jgi:hypothetical protein
MANCGCTQEGCSCLFEEPDDGSIVFTGSGTLVDPIIFTAPNDTYVRPAARMIGTIQLNPPVVATVVEFDSEEIDTDNMINIAGNPTRLTIQTAGFYLLGGQVRFQSAGGGTPAAIGIIRNGSGIYESRDSMTEREGTIEDYVSTQCFVSCIVSDYFELFSDFDSGGFNHNIEIMNFWAIRLGDNA